MFQTISLLNNYQTSKLKAKNFCFCVCFRLFRVLVDLVDIRSPTIIKFAAAKSFYKNIFEVSNSLFKKLC